MMKDKIPGARLIAGNSRYIIGTWVGMVPAYPSTRLRIYRGIFMYHLLCTDNDTDIWVYSATRRFLKGRQNGRQICAC